MALRILLAFDKFKGSLTACEVAEAFGLGWCDVMPDARLDVLPIADGGDGILTTLVETLDGDYHNATVRGPLNTPLEARWGTIDDGATAIIEMAEAAGLRLLEAEERNPLRTTTYGVGELMARALESGCRRVIMGLGGSATNDGGMGLLQALGVRFYDSEGAELEASGEAMYRVASVDATDLDARLRGRDIVIASDVDNPLFGERGAAYVYAPQKGATPDVVEHLDEGLRGYHSAVMQVAGCDYSECRGAGAAGGVGYALMALLGARMQSGVELVFDLLDFESRAKGVDLIITGEGRLDRQTLMGKAPSGVLSVGRRLGIPVIAVGGGVEAEAEDALLEGGFYAVYASTPEGMPLEEAMKKETAQQNLRRAARRIASDYLSIMSL
jgi:glycerate kinase